jgi:hypothetical protein
MLALGVPSTQLHTPKGVLDKSLYPPIHMREGPTISASPSRAAADNRSFVPGPLLTFVTWDKTEEESRGRIAHRDSQQERNVDRADNLRAASTQLS